MATFIDADSSLFEDDSFTVSYNFDTKFWYSFHDYIGNFRISTRNQNVYSFFNKAIYLHNQNGYCNFYENIVKKSYITPTFNPQARKEERLYAFILDSLNIHCDFFNVLNKKILNKTLSTISIHNSYQSSTEIVLRAIDQSESIKSQWERINIRLLRNAWFFNKIRDETNDQNLATLEEKFDEIVSNVIRVNCDKKKRLFVDDFVIVKLTYDNKDQLEMAFSEINFDITLVRI